MLVVVSSVIFDYLEKNIAASSWVSTGPVFQTGCPVYVLRLKYGSSDLTLSEWVKVGGECESAVRFFDLSDGTQSEAVPERQHGRDIRPTLVHSKTRLNGV